jgi:hypothetical protein
MGRKFGGVSTFEGGALVQFQREHVFRANRDALAEAIRHVDDIDVLVKSRIESDGRVEMVNAWRLSAPIPASVASVIRPHMLFWQDRAVWTTADHACRWSVESPFFPDIRCGGVTHFEEASRGRATKVSLRGELSIDPRAVPVATPLAQRALARTAEELVAAFFPVILRRFTDALATHLRDAGHTPADRRVSGFTSVSDAGDGGGDSTTRRVAGRDER